MVNVPISNGGTIDIDGSGVADFSFVFNNTQVLRIVGINGASNASTASSTLDGFNQYYYSAVLASGSQVDGSLTFLTSTALAENGFSTSPEALGSFSTGVRFTGTDSLVHYGWVNFSLVFEHVADEAIEPNQHLLPRLHDVREGALRAFLRIGERVLGFGELLDSLFGPPPGSDGTSRSGNSRAVVPRRRAGPELVQG